VKGARASAWLAGICAANLLWGSPAGGAEAFITDQTGDELSVLDLGSKQVVARIPVLGKPPGSRWPAMGAPPMSRARKANMSDTASRNIVSKIAIPDTPLGIAADPAGRFIYVAGFYQPRLYKIDLATGTIAASVEVGASPSGVALTPDGALIVTADRDDNQISIIDAKTFARKGTVKVGAHPFGVTIDPQGARAYMADVESNDVSVVDLAGEKLLGSVAVGKRPYAVALAKGRGFSTDQYGGTVSVVSTRRKARFVSGPETVAGGIDKTTARDHDPAAATPFDRFHRAGTGDDRSRRDLDRATWTLDESDPVVNITNHPVRD
jgi:YVTN family beta-propeller protein